MIAPLKSRSASELGFPFPRPSAARQRPRRAGLDSRYTPLPGKRTRAANRLFPQACVILGSFPRSKDTPISGQNTVKGHPPPSLIRSKDTPIQVVGQIVKEQVVGAATPVDKSAGNKTRNNHHHSRTATSPEANDPDAAIRAMVNCHRVREISFLITTGFPSQYKSSSIVTNSKTPDILEANRSYMFGPIRLNHG